MEGGDSDMQAGAAHVAAAGAAGEGAGVGEVSVALQVNPVTEAVNVSIDAVEPEGAAAAGTAAAGGDTEMLPAEQADQALPAPDATAPDATAPDATAPDATAPDATAPDATAPDATAPQAAAPSATEAAEVAEEPAADVAMIDAEAGPSGEKGAARGAAGAAGEGAEAGAADGLPNAAAAEAAAGGAGADDSMGDGGAHGGEANGEEGARVNGEGATAVGEGEGEGEGQEQDLEAQMVACIDALHEEIVRFAEEAAPTPEEVAHKEAALLTIRTACETALQKNKRMKVQLFGSGAHGISLRNSDLDVVITNLITPFQLSGAFTPEQKANVGTCLRRVSEALMRERACARRPLIIYNARVPVAKADMSNGIRADISIGGDDGVKAAQFLKEQQERFPTLRPLCMVLKALLLDQGLVEVNKGGLSTWSLCNMALALLMEQEKAGCPVDSTGHLLLGFLKYYGRVFNYTTQAVAVRQGGIVPKASVPTAGGARPGQAGQGADVNDASRQSRLCVEDPMTGRDVANGSHQIQLVAQALRDASAKLELLLKSSTPPAGGFLPLLINVAAVLEGKAGTAAAAAAAAEGAGVAAGGAGGGAGAKRAREGAAQGGPRKGGPGPGPMKKQQGGLQGAGGSRGFGSAGPLRAGDRGRPLMTGAASRAQQASAGAMQGVQGPVILGGGGMLPAGMMVQQSMPSMGGMATVMLPIQQGAAAPAQQFFLPAQQAAQQFGGAGAVVTGQAPGGGLLIFNTPGGGQQAVLQPAGFATAQQAQQPAQQLLVQTPMGLQLVGQAGVQQSVQQLPGMAQQGPVYFQQGGFMQ